MFEKLIVFGILALGCAYPFNPRLDELWTNYKVRFNKKYGDEEDAARRVIWEMSIDKIMKHNLEADLKMHSHHLGLNIFADMTNEEYLILMKRRKTESNSTCFTSFLPSPKTVAPNEVDWRTKGFVPRVKNQGECGSPSVMSAVSCMESLNAKKIGKLVSLSVQNVIDCCGPSGCVGGESLDAYFICITKMGGLDSEISYPPGKEGICHFNKSGIAARCRGCVYVPSGNEEALKVAVATVGPIATYVDASSFDFQLYSGGIYDNPYCSSTELDHSLLIVGYGTENGKYYWLLQNSWGESWGINGYIKMSRNKNNQCGIASQPTYPLVV